MKRSAAGRKLPIIYVCGSQNYYQRQRYGQFKLEVPWSCTFLGVTCPKSKIMPGTCQRSSISCQSSDFKVNCMITASNQNEAGNQARCKHILCVFLACIMMMSANAEITRTRSNITNLTTSPNFVDSTLLKQSTLNPFAVEKRRDGISTVKSKQMRSTLTSVTDTIKDIHPNLNQPNESVKLKPVSVTFNKPTSKYFLLKLFKRYSNENFLSIENFEKILKHVGVGVFEKTSISSVHSHIHKQEEEDYNYNQQNETHVEIEASNKEMGSSILIKKSDDSHPKSNINKLNLRDVKANSNTQENVNIGSINSNPAKINEQLVSQTEPNGKLLHSDHCLSQHELLQSFDFDHQESLSPINFVQLCPALIDQLDGGYCKDHSNNDHGHSHDSHDDHSHKDHDGGEDPDHYHHAHVDDKFNGSAYDKFEHPSAKVWLITFLSVTIICVCSIAGVLVIPNMNRVFYNHALQFLVALAVGAMSADAMLHLLPHALLSETHHAHHHHNPLPGNETSKVLHPSGYMSAMYKGLVALMGIYMFFFLERLFTLFTNHRSKKRNMNNEQWRLQRIKDGKSPDNKDHEKEIHIIPSCDEVVMVVHPNKALKAFADVKHEALLHSCDESLTFSPSGHEVSHAAAFNGNTNRLNVCSSVSVYSDGLLSPGTERAGQFKGPSLWSDAELVGLPKERELEMNLENHAHSHMSKDYRGSVSSVAMMIVVGDMIHNFCDGLGVGTAFAGNIAGGLSTSFAVFCHELPHKIGDFAVLVRSGLSLKKAMFYNVISSIPIFIGAVIGLIVGNMAASSLWIFAGVGGMFLYITLVDLVPEMTSVYTKIGEPWFLHLLLQASGIAVGTTIVLIISVSEESLLTTLQD